MILCKLREFAPDIYDALEQIGAAMNTPEEQEVLHDIYPVIRKISIDYAVMEPSAANGDVLVIPCDCGWNDVGSWDMMPVLNRPDANGNVLVGDVTAEQVKRSVVFSTSRKVAVLGAEDLIVVETEDAVMVCPKHQAQNVKQLVDILAAEGRNELL